MVDMEQEATTSSTGIEAEVEAGSNVRNQLLIWDTLIEWRIILQKLLVSSNQLPQPNDWKTIFGDKSDSISKSAQSELRTLLNSFLDLQDVMVESNSKLFDPQDEDDEEIDDEEIASDVEDIDDEVEDDKNDDSGSEDDIQDEDEDQNDDEEVSGVDKEANDGEKSTSKKRKLSAIEIEDALQERMEYLRESRNKVLDEWYNKTRFSSANSLKQQSKSMDSVELPPTVQVQQILSNQKRLIKRTQLKRSNFSIIGKQTTEGKDDEEYDCEIFDDDDFYHQLLRELIDSKTSNDSDSISISRKWLEIQKMRGKMKKKVDTKASKGRKIRFDVVHKELINFMAPIVTHNFTEEAKDELFDSLFQTS